MHTSTRHVSPLLSALLLLTLLHTVVACSNPSEDREEVPDMTAGRVDMAPDVDAREDMLAPPPVDMTQDASPAVDMPADDGVVDDGPDEPDAAVDMTDADAAVDMPLPDGPARLRLATWNIHFLAAPGQGDEAPRQPEDYARLQYYNTKLAADVVALQEIRGEAGVHTVFSPEDWSVQCEERNSGQNVCLAVRQDSGWSVQRHPDVEALRVGNPNLRAGLDVTLSQSGYSSLRLLIVHMRFSCFTGTETTNCMQYFSQLMVLSDWMNARHAAQEPFIVLGDFNRFFNADDPAWGTLDAADPPTLGLARSIPAGNTPCWSDTFTEYIDHILLGSVTSTWLQGSEQLPFEETDFEASYERLSDHCPVWADLDVPRAP